MVCSPPGIWIHLCESLCQEKTRKSYNGGEGESYSQTDGQPPSLLHLVLDFSFWSNIFKIALCLLNIRVRRIHNTELEVRNMFTSTISIKVNSLLPSLNLNRSWWIALPRKTRQLYNGSEGESSLQTDEQPLSLFHIMPYFSS